MTNASPPPTAEPGATDRADQAPRPPRGDVLDLGRLRRSNHERRIAGVAAGLARHLDIDPIIVRVTLVVLVFFGGAGLLLYGAVWLLAPEEGSPAQPLGLDDRNRGIALIGTGILAALAAVGDFAGAFWFPWPLVIIGLLVVWFLNRNNGAPTLYHPPAPGQTSSPSEAPGTTWAPQPGWQTQTMPQTGASSTPYVPYVQPDAQLHGQTYGEAYGQTTGQPYAYDPQRYARPRNPRKRGPILFWFTLALIATGIGTLGLIDAAGTEVPDPAYPALALALTGAMLVLGSFWGRAGGLIFIGLVAGAATLAATVSNNYDGENLAYTPTSSTDVRGFYQLEAGELVLDLTEVRDVDGLDGREITIDGGVGEIEVIVPDGMDVTATATAGVGDVSIFDEHNGGIDVGDEGFLDGGTDAPELRIVIDHGVGEVTVRQPLDQ